MIHRFDKILMYSSSFNRYILTIIFISFLSFLSPLAHAQNKQDSLMMKYQNYRSRLFNEFIVRSADVEFFGTNIPYTHRHLRDDGSYKIFWDDGNSAINNYGIFLTTEIELLKRNNQNYSESLESLIYLLMAIERLDLYSENSLRTFKNKKVNVGNDSISDVIIYPADINGFMLRDDVSLGFWMANHNKFKTSLGQISSDSLSSSNYLSVFHRGVIPRQAMSQDNVIRILSLMAMINHFLDIESIDNIEIRFINTLIPDYLKSKSILVNNSINFDKWTIDISTRIIRNLQQDNEQSRLVFTPFSKHASAKSNTFGSIIKTRWYKTNPVLDTLVAEGNGSDMGIFINAYGFAEFGNRISKTNSFHFDNSDGWLNKYLFYSIIYKEFNFPLGISIPIPENFDDGLPRELAAIAGTDMPNHPLLFQLRDKREVDTYEHLLMMNYLLFASNYVNVYNSKTLIWKEDSSFVANLLHEAPFNGPHSDTSLSDYSIKWNTPSRIVWPSTDTNTFYTGYQYYFAGLDYLMLHNLYRLVYGDSKFYNQNRNKKHSIPNHHLNRNSKNNYHYFPNSVSY